MGGLIYPQSVLDNMQTKLGKTENTRKEDAAFRQFEALREAFRGSWNRHNADVWPRRLLDIGCGFGLIDIHIAGACPALEEIHLVDGDGSAPSGSSFRTDQVAWSDVRMAGALVRANVSDRVRVHEYFAGPGLALGCVFDLVISTRSWGHHYPARIYADLVKEHLAPDGIVIMDIRRKSNGLEEMKAAGFRIVGQIPDHSHKCYRWVFEHGAGD
jgi:SAM-dependent methyltransferase